MNFKIGDKCWSPDSSSMGQGVVTEIGTDNDCKVAHIDVHGRKNERWFSNSVLQPVPTEKQREVEATYTFRAKHFHDWNPCAANVKLMTEYVRTHFSDSGGWTADNLERAFLALRSKLAPVVAPVQKETPMAVTPAPAAPATPAVTPAPATPTPVDVRGLKRKIAAMSGAQLRSAMKDPEFVQQCAEAGIQILSGSWEDLRANGTARPGPSRP